MKKIIRSVGVCFAIAAIIFTGVLLWGTVAQASGLVNRQILDESDVNKKVSKNSKENTHASGVIVERKPSTDVRKNVTVVSNSNQKGNLHSTVIRNNVNMRVSRKSPTVKATPDSIRKERVRKKADEKN